MNQEDFDAKEDYLRWRKMDFSFCAENACAALLHAIAALALSAQLELVFILCL